MIWRAAREPRKRRAFAVPAGVALRDPRQQLFDAAARVLLRDGVTGLTSRAVTTEAGVAKVDTLAPTLIGAVHLLFTARKGSPAKPEAVRKVMTTVLAGAMRQSSPHCESNVRS
jgi:hypothetical protein